MRIVFFGTPDFATPTLRALIGEGYDVVAVVTQPDRPRRRAHAQLEPSPVKAVALEEGIPVLQPERPRGAEFLAALRALAPDVGVVVAYGHILPHDVIDLPRLGTFNVHASLLPKYRGAAPIQAAVRDGCEETGVTVQRMVEALDAGPVVNALSTTIPPEETAGELALRLSELGATAMVEALVLLDVGQAVEVPQDESAATRARKIEREDARIEWTAPATTVQCAIRAYDPKPGAWTTLSGAEVRCFGARVVPGASGAPGAVLEASSDGVLVACGVGAVRIAEFHPAGRKRVTAGDWVRGRGIAVGQRFE
ncbi:MAG: methionyl-tRNA formyltransferase [Gemmatimonadetes bacterium]|nr:methionyl-tRNA formyltransferase [Gemmatimonadota bacterium]MBI3569457.1 methionyl-tRNA formyltransferase [Gemmatimonadota bacterium]